MPEQQKLFAVPQTEITSDDYYTPKLLFDRLGLTFDLDVCAPPGGVDWIPARQHLTQEQDALVTDWFGRVWMNPPFSNPGPFVRKFVDHSNGVALVPTSNGRWMTSLWESPVRWVALDYLRFHKGKSEKPMKTAIPIRCWLVAIGDECEEALSHFGKVR